MASTTHTISVAASADDGDYFNGTASITGQWLTIGSHTTDSVGPWVGFRFQVDSTLAAIDTADITDVRVVLRANVSGTFSGRWRVDQSTAAAFATSGSNRADNRHNAIGSTGEVLQGSTSVTGGADFQSDDISARVISALASLTTGDYLGITCGIDLSVAGNYYVQAASYDHVSAPAPKLVITYDVDPVDAEVTTTAPAVTTGVPTPGPNTYTLVDSTSYHDSTGDSGQRTLDLLIPGGDAPAGGWPVVTWAHGGAWNSGNENGWTWVYAKRALDAGCAFLSWTYKKTTYNIIFNTNTGFSRPNTISDGMAMLKWISTNAGTYDLDPDRIVMTGESAGGHLAFEVALLHSDDDRDTYSMAYQGLSTLAGGSSRRYAVYSDFEVAQGRDMSTVSIIGAALFAAPIDLTTLRAGHTGGTFEALWSQVLNAYFGAPPNSGDIMSSFDGEGDLNSHITGESSTIYAARDATAPPWPILYIQATDDPVALIEGSYDALVAALDTAGYPTTAASSVVDTDGLTFRTYTDGGTTDQPHTRVLTDTANLDLFSEWLEAVLSGVDNGETTTAPQLNVNVPTPTITTAVNNGQTTSAPVATVTVPTPTVSTANDNGLTISAPVATVTVPTPTITAATNNGLTTSAGQVTVTVPTPTILAGGDNAISTTAPGVTFTVTPNGSVYTVGAVTTEAPEAGFIVPTPSVGAESSSEVTITAPEAEFIVPDPALATTVNITTVAPRVTVTVPFHQTDPPGASASDSGMPSLPTDPSLPTLV